MTAALLATALVLWPTRPSIAPGRARIGYLAAGEPLVFRVLGLLIMAGAVAAAGLTARSIPVGLAALAAAVTGWLLVRAALRERGRRLARIELVAVTRALARELAAGSGLEVALNAALHGAGPVGRPLLERLGHGARCGWAGTAAVPSGLCEPLEQALVAAMRMSHRQGIPLSALVSRIADTLSDEAEAAEQRTSAVAGARLSGYLLAGLPALGTVLGMSMGANPISVLTGGGLGSVLLLTGVTLSCAGLLWSARIAG